MIETASLNSIVFGWLARRLGVRLAGIFWPRIVVVPAHLTMPK